jgi:GrpB-like predicted nucleotidyltransferase (UPF0157 family)
MTTPTKYVVAPYDPAWAERAGQLAAEFRTGLGPLALRVEHIGSTSIPGMAAKPVYGPLAGYGLVRRPWEQDHIPAGRDDAPELWQKRLWNKPAPGGERIIVHVRVAGAPNERLALLFRDWFRAHPDAVPAYAQFKLRLADVVDDLDVYTDIKDPVVDLVIAVAERWAAETGWTPAAP